MLEFETDRWFIAFVSDASSFYLFSSWNEIYKIDHLGLENIIDKFNFVEGERRYIDQTNIMVNLEKESVVFKRMNGSKIIENGSVRDGVDADLKPWLFRPHLYKNAYRSKKYFVSKLPLTNKEPQLLLSSRVISECYKVGRGIVVYNMETQEYRTFKVAGTCQAVAITLDNSKIATATLRNGRLFITIFDNDV